MGFWASLLGRDIKNENKTKPFYANTNAQERKDWFARTPPWHKVHPQVIEALIAKLDAEPLKFELFVLASMKLEVVDQYANIRNESVGIACTIVAGLLCKAGTAAAQQMFALKQAHDRGQAPAGGFDAAVRCAGAAIDAFESSVNLDRNMIPAYSGLVWLLGSIGRVDDAVKYAREGLVAVREMKKSANVLRQSSIEAVRSSPESFDEIERMFVGVIEESEKLPA